MVLVACGGSATAGHHPRAHPAESSLATPTPSNTPAAPPSAPPVSATPAPAAAPTSLIPQHDQSLTLSGAVTGTVATAEVKDCGTGNARWALELSSMTIGGGTASLTLLVNSYHGPGSYRPGGALNAIRNQQLLVFPVTGGSLDISGVGTSGQMNLTLTSSAGQKVQIQGTWACS